MYVLTLVCPQPNVLTLPVLFHQCTTLIFRSSDAPSIILRTDCSCSGASRHSLFYFIPGMHLLAWSLMIRVIWWRERFESLRVPDRLLKKTLWNEEMEHTSFMGTVKGRDLIPCRHCVVRRRHLLEPQRHSKQDVDQSYDIIINFSLSRLTVRQADKKRKTQQRLLCFGTGHNVFLVSG
jgi:hypothetical protein